MCMAPKQTQKRRVHVRLREKDWIRLELISDTFGVSRSDAFRAALVAMCRQLGFEKEFSTDLLKIK